MEQTTIKERLENYSLLKLTREEQVKALQEDFQALFLATIMNRDSIATIQAHTSVVNVVRDAIATLELPQDLDTGGNRETENTEFKKFCAAVPVTEVTTEELEKIDPSLLSQITDDQLFIQVMKESTRLNILLEQFLTTTGAKSKIQRSGLPFEPTIGEKRMLALMAALFAPEVEDHNKVLVK